MNTLLVDCGAVGNLTGSDVIRKQVKEAEMNGRNTTWTKLAKPRNVSGVGDNAKTCEYAVALPARLESGRELAYHSPVIGGTPSPCPSLYGLDPMSQLNTYMGMRSGLLAMVPDGKEQDIQWPAGTTFEQCRKSASGHWNLVINAWKMDTQAGREPSSPTEEYVGNCHNCKPNCSCRFWSPGKKRPWITRNDPGYAGVMSGTDDATITCQATDAVD